MDVSSLSSSEYPDGVAFRYKFPKGTDFALRSVGIYGGVPEFHFSTSNKVPSITEEDVAVCVQLCHEKKRPEFFYCPFLPNHPFACLGRHYKHYNPGWLRGTFVGELFAEVDWKMKGLDADVMSDESKETFWSWSKASKLDGLATWDKFTREKDSGQVLMTCESVDVSESENELLFVGEPKMKIDVTTSPSYTDYLTENFDSIAYHDEPTFLKMKEIVKLMLAVEWLRDNGVEFSDEWLKEHTNKQKSHNRKPVQINLSNEERSQMFERFQEGIKSAMKKLPPISDLPSAGAEIDAFHPEISLVAADEKVTDSGLEFTLETKHTEPIIKALTELYVPVVTKVVVKVTVDDFNFLLEGTGIDPNEPVIASKDDGLVKPGVSSWAELFAETMPYPCKVIEGPDSKVQVLGGGCTTSTIPVRKTAPPTTPEIVTAQVPASRSRKKEKIVPKNSQKSGRYPPPREISQCSAGMEKKEVREKFGCADNTSRSLFSADGELTDKKPSLKGLVQIQQLIGGEEVGEVLFLNMYLPSPCKMDAPEDSAYSSTMSLTAN